MDENYLDNLLNEFSLDKEIDHKIEEELDDEITSEKRRRRKANALSRDEAFNMDLEQDADSVLAENELDFSEEQIDELDHLDNLADIDIGDMDFSDIDFDDIDITKLGEELPDDFDDLLNDFDGDLEIPDFSMEDEKQEDEPEEYDNSQEAVKEEISEVYDGNENLSVDDPSFAESAYGDNSLNEEAFDNTSAEEESAVNNNSAEESGDLNVDSFDADSFLDSLLTEEEGIETVKENSDNNQTVNDVEADLSNFAESDGGIEQDSLDSLLGDEPAGDSTAGDNTSGSDDLQPIADDDDLFSMLNLDEMGTGDGNLDGGAGDNPELTMGSIGSSESELEIADTGSEKPQEKPKKKKRTFMEILFGEPDEDDIETEEEIQAREAKKAEKLAKKEAAKAAKAEKAEKAKAKKSQDDAKKKKDDAEKKRIKAEKKAKKKAEEAANAEPEKKLNKPMVIFIFSVVLGGVGFIYLSTVDFNYKLVIKQAADYFASQKYHMAYDEIKGVEVKEKDKELKERIYTVMYVERLYESYENNIQMGRNKKALDSLLRGVTKYYEYIDEAKELDILSDLDYSFARIQNALQNNYGITLEQAIAINDLDDYEYMKTIEQYTEGTTEE